MNITKLIDTTKKVIPLLAALPYEISVEDGGAEAVLSYNPTIQRTFFASGKKDFSTSRFDESVGGVFSKSKSDTKKDD